MGNIKSTQSDKFIDCKKKIYIVSNKCRQVFHL